MILRIRVGIFLVLTFFHGTPGSGIPRLALVRRRPRLTFPVPPPSKFGVKNNDVSTLGLF